jgi:Domain of unknown function (DUF4082)/Abnormal spindle-like microcephaly-assoc'd, ASPM-SPD-2-Hydin
VPYRNSFSTPAGRVVSTSALHSTIRSSRGKRPRSFPAKLPLLRGALRALLLVLACGIALSAPADAQISLLPTNVTPASVDIGDTHPTELGMKFKSDTSGYITALRFYKAKNNGGTHTAHIWSTSGKLLGSASFTNETASGWQQVTFATPVAISANTVYVASYFAPFGHYSETVRYFLSAVNNAPLHALASETNDPNGVFLHSANSGFPTTTTWQATNFWVDIVFSAKATAANPQLKVSATTLSFGSVAVNTAATSSVTLTSTGTSAVTVNSASITGTGFSIVASSFPVTLNPNQSLTLQVQFKPTASGAATGKLTINSNSTTGSTATVSLSGTGAAANPQLKVSATTLSFGSVAVNSATTGSVTLTSSGTTAVTVSSASISGTGFSIVGGTFPATLNPNQTMTLKLQFKATAAGSDTGKLTINSNSTTGATATVALSGTGTAVAGQVDLSWDAPSSSADPVAGYNVYRAIGSGAFQLVNSSMDKATTYVDTGVVSGDSYNYIVKSVDTSGVESAPSNEIAVSVP